MEYDKKAEKSTIINLCGVKYKAKHASSKSINNRFLLFLAQIKYFIKRVLKTLSYCLNKIIDIILYYILPYDEPIVALCCSYLVFGLFFMIVIIIADLNITEGTPHSDGHDPNLPTSYIIYNHIIDYSLIYVKANVVTIFGIPSLSYILLFIKNAIILVYKMGNMIIRFIVNKLINYYSIIPDVEPIDPLDIV